MDEIAKLQEDKLPEFAIKTQLLTRRAGEKERLDKAKEQMHFKQLLRSKSEEEDDQVNEKCTTATEGTIQSVLSVLWCSSVARMCAQVNFVQGNSTTNTRFIVERQVERKCVSYNYFTLI